MTSVARRRAGRDGGEGFDTVGGGSGRKQGQQFGSVFLVLTRCWRGGISPGMPRKLRIQYSGGRRESLARLPGETAFPLKAIGAARSCRHLEDGQHEGARPHAALKGVRCRAGATGHLNKAMI